MNEAFRALADPTRREILRLLRKQPMSAGDLADRFSQSRSTLSGHFAVLKAADLVRTERRAQTIVYSLNTSVFEEVATVLLDLFAVGQTKDSRAPRVLRARKDM